LLVQALPGLLSTTFHQTVVVQDCRSFPVVGNNDLLLEAPCGGTVPRPLFDLLLAVQLWLCNCVLRPGQSMWQPLSMTLGQLLKAGLPL
jgi:hypothetical protein